jgi:alcohol dehydrogenase/L-iditol 2-dehydrogenase
MQNLGLVNFANEKGAVELREVEVPEFGDDEVLFEVKAVSVCGSDLHQWHATQSWQVNYPVVLGHEFAGVVSKVGSRVTSFKPGDRVVSETAALINHDSPMTRAGLYNLDPNRKGFGYGVNGAMTKFVKVPARLLHRIPESLSFDEAALTEPCAVAFSATIAPGRLRVGDRIVVYGPGPIGILCAAMAKLGGAEVALVGLESDIKRLEIARDAYGVEPIVGDAKDWAFKFDGCGADGVVDAAGVSASLKAALEVIRPDGWISKVGWGPQPLDFSLDPLVAKNVALLGSFSHNWNMWERVLNLLGTKRLDVMPLIGGAWPLEKWQEAFMKMKSQEVIKSVINP